MWKVRYFDEQTGCWYTGLTVDQQSQARDVCQWLQGLGWQAEVRPDWTAAAADDLGTPLPDRQTIALREGRSSSGHERQSNPGAFDRLAGFRFPRR